MHEIRFIGLVELYWIHLDDTDVQQETAKKPITDSNNLTTPDTSLLETAVLMDDGESESDADKLLPQNFSTTDKEKEDPEIVRVGSLENR